jgi:16S rRNA (guanine966-N2)-methyltransferase
MRIISGKFKGRSLYGPQDAVTRPTADRVRESIFNLLENSLYLKWEGLHVLDLYAGTGALGVEALSRGASFCLFIDNHSAAVEIIKKNTTSFPHVSIWQNNVFHLKSNPYVPFDVVFLDPPYKKDLIPTTIKTLLSSHYIKESSYIVAELSHTEEMNDFDSLEKIKEKIYGKTTVAIFRYKKPL